MRSLILLALLAVSPAAAADEVVGVVLTAGGTSVGGSPVRIVGERFVVYAHSDAGGRFLVRDLPPGSYRVELEREDLHTIPIRELRITPPRPMCVLPSRYPRSFGSILGSTRPRQLMSAPPRRGHVDTASTQQGIRIDSPGRLGR